MKRRWKIVIAAFVLLVLTVTIYRSYYSFQFNHRVEALAEAGVPISFADLDAADALPPGTPNAADLYQKAFEQYQKPDESLKSFLPYQGSYKISEDEPPFPDEVIEAIAATLEANTQTLALLDQGAAIGDCAFTRQRPPEMTKQDHLLHGLLSNIRDCGLLLCERNLYLAQTHQAEKLVAGMSTLLDFSECPIRKGMLIDEMVVLALKNAAVENLECFLGQGVFTDAQLANLQHRFYDVQDLEAGYRGFVKDRIYFLTCVNSPFDERPEKPHILNRWRERIYSILGLMQKEHVMKLDYFEWCIDAAQLPLEERPDEFYDISCDLGINVPLWQLYLSSIVGNIKVAEIDIRVIGNLRCAQAALVVERYRLRYGELPESLDVLVPEFMEAVPAEPFDGQPLRYVRHEDGGCTIYTIGDDGVDNGGLSREQMAEETGADNPDEYDWPFTVKR